MYFDLRTFIDSFICLKNYDRDTPFLFFIVGLGTDGALVDLIYWGFSVDLLKF